MIIRLKIDRQIVWPLVALYMLQFFFGAHKVVYVVSLIWLASLMVRENSMIITLPRVNGLLYYSIVIVMATVIGMFSNEVRDVVKDIYYISQPVIIITIGYLYEGLNNGKSIKRTLYLIGTFISIVTLFRVLVNIPNLTDLESVRNIANLSVYEVTFVATIMFGDKILSKKVIFGNIMDWVMLGLMVVKVIISMGRTELVSIVAMIGIILVFNVFFSKQKWTFIFKIIGIVAAVAVMVIGIYIALPEEAKEQFSNKINYSFQEIETDLDYDNYIDAIQHWRGFEIDQAQKQWKSSNMVTQIVGGGLGTYVKVKYLPNEFTEDMYKGHSIALLHNVYYTLLIKGGLLGMAALIWLYIANILPVFRKKYVKYRPELIVQCAITAAMMFMSYLVMANYNVSMYITWGIMTGWTNALIRGYKR